MLNLRDKIQNLQNIHILVDNMYEIKFKLRQSGYVHTKDTTTYRMAFFTRMEV